MIDPSRLSLNQATVKRSSLPEAVDLCARHDVAGIGLWRDRVAEHGLAQSVALTKRAGVHVSSLCRAGFFTHVDAEARRAAEIDNARAIEEAAELEADVLVLVSGGLPQGTRDLGVARRMIADAVGRLVPRAEALGVRLGIEPLHPMFCADRCAVSRLTDAIDMAAAFPESAVGVVVDSYHVWWDADLLGEISRAGPCIASFQVCDWLVPLPADMLLGRGHLGDGHIDFRPMAQAVLATGYEGFVEVEIFNQDVWDAPAEETIATVQARFAAVFG